MTAKAQESRRALLNWSGALAGLLLLITGGLLEPAWLQWNDAAGLQSINLESQLSCPLCCSLLCSAVHGRRLWPPLPLALGPVAC